ASGAMWVKWPGTHQVSGPWWSETVLGIVIDANGNTLSDPSGKSYTWDFENRMVSAVVPGTGTVTFKYDPFGRRIYKLSPNATSIFLYSGTNLLETVNGSGSEVASYAQTRNIDELLAELRASTADYYEADALGSITSLSNSSGTLANTYTYDSFGNLTASTGALRNYFQYTGREFDQETGAYYYRARYYDEQTGRFISEDPTKFKGGINFYPYVKNSSLNWRDPDGKASAGGWWNVYNWGTQVFGWVNCTIQADYCLTGLQAVVSSLQGMSNDVTLNNMAANNKAYDDDLNLKLGCSTGTCLPAFDKCLKAGQAIPLPTPPIPGP
ncbi:MAG: RHS repeat-associated core domain-containing protein, partial [Candidatus Sulfotelmatobacter sp.]